MFKLLRPASLAEPLQHLNRFQRLVANNARVAYLVSRSKVYAKVRLHAQALAFKTLLAVVPLMAVVFAIFNGFGGLRSVRVRVESLIVENLAGSPEIREVVHEYLGRFLANVEGGAVGPVSVVILIFSVLSLLSHIEDSINALFGLTAKRPWVLRFTTYWAILTLGPIVLGASLTLTGAMQVGAVKNLVESLPGSSKVLLTVTPLLISWLGFTAFYVVVPNTKVKLRSAFFAALISGTAWNILKFLYAYYATHAVTVQNIYGSLAAIPLFMVWIWLSWLLVLYGAQLTYTYENLSLWHTRAETEPSPRAREQIAIRVMLEIARDFMAGQPATTAATLCQRLALPSNRVEETCRALHGFGFVSAIEPCGWKPARALSSISVEDVLMAFREKGGETIPLLDEPTDRYVVEILAQEKLLTKELLSTDFAVAAARFPLAQDMVKT